jgi:hypothetical protein
VNTISAGLEGATIAGGGRGSSNCFSHADNTQDAGSCANRIASRMAFIGGGFANNIGAGSPAGTITAGYANYVANNSEGSNISGGTGHYTEGAYSTVGGGLANIVFKNYSVVAGGRSNIIEDEYSVVAGGFSNNVYTAYATISGGENNDVGGKHATVPGGRQNYAAGANSFAFGVRAQARSAQSLVWGGSPDVNTDDQGEGTFVAYAPGGFFFYRGIVGSGGCTLPAGTVSWSCTSDRNTKSNITPLNPRDVLREVMRMPIARWSYRGTEAITNIGPMAQDFWQAFRVGDSDKSIASMNMSGVALAAIQGLNQKLTQQVRAKDREIVALRSELNALKPELAAIKKRLGM